MANRTYSLEEKYAAAAHYYQYHNCRKLETELGIPYTTIRSWLEQPWWHDLMKQVIKDVDAEMRSTGLAIIRKAQEEIMDRLVNGDAVVTKIGSLIRKPVALRDALFTFLTTFDKNRIINMQPTSISGQSASIADLAKQLEDVGKRAKDTKPEPEQEKANPVEEVLPLVEGEKL